MIRILVLNRCNFINIDVCFVKSINNVLICIDSVNREDNRMIFMNMCIIVSNMLYLFRNMLEVKINVFKMSQSCRDIYVFIIIRREYGWRFWRFYYFILISSCIGICIGIK